MNKPLLTRDEAVALTLRWRNGDIEARNTLVERNQGLVRSIARQYFSTDPATEPDDLMQVGNLGLFDAIDHYDPDRDTAFSTYAYYWIRQAIQRAVATAGTIKRANWPKRNQKTEEARKAASLRQAKVARLDAPLSGHEDGTLVDFLAAPDCVEDEALARIEAERLLSSLRPHHRRMVEARADGATLAEAGAAGDGEPEAAVYGGRTMKFHDFFAGIGGSSTGLHAAGMEGVVALNHWHYAIELHNANHPEMDHDEADVWKADPRRYRPAEVGWFSPECRAHSRARGKSRDAEHYVTDLWRNPTTDPADDRSRLLMESVPYISELAGYRYVLVENVVEVVKWVHFDRWLKEMAALGYEWKLLFLNSQFFGTPQSRDRFFAVFWKRGESAPNLDFQPSCLCSKCGWVNGVQAWKPGRWYGKYDQQYTYVCPHCARRVEPEINGAYTVIDWTQPMPRIGDRERGLSPLTLKKIEYGLKKFAASAMVVDTAYSDSNKSRPVDAPLFTQTRQQSFALTVSYYGRENAVKSANEPLMTVPTENKIGLAYIETLRKNTNPTAMEKPMPTVISGGNQHALVMSYYGNPVIRPVDEPMPTVPTVEKHSLIQPEVDLDDVRFRMLKPRELASGTGFPRSYILNGSQKNQVKGIGGAVDPNVARWLGERILEAVR